MTTPTTQAMLAQAMAELQAGQRTEAEARVRAAIARDPESASAQCSLGLILMQTGRAAAAIEAYRQALRMRPNDPAALNNLGIALRMAGRLDESIAAYRQAAGLRPGFAEALRNLGDALCAKGQADESIEVCRQSLALLPANAYALLSLGNALMLKGELAEAIEVLRQAVVKEPRLAEAFVSLSKALSQDGRDEEAASAAERAIALRPDYGDAYDNLSMALRRLDRFEEAATAAKRAIELGPRSVEAQLNLGMALNGLERHEDAVTAYRQAVAIQPDYAKAWHNLGLTLALLHQYDEADAAYQKALSLMPVDAKVHKNLGLLYRDQGRLDEAIAVMRRATELNRTDPTCHSNLIFAMSGVPGIEPEEILGEARSWNQRHAAALAAEVRPHRNDRSPDRRLRIGYVSADLYRHVVGRSFLPLVSHHDHERFEVYCYASGGLQDELRGRIRACTDVWRDIGRLKDAEAAELIREDRIDILVDLALHTAGNRLLVFARKPAPVQVSFLGYPGTTGLREIEYRLTDPYLDPPGMHDDQYSEESIRLANNYWCYDPGAEAMPAELPGAEAPSVRAGSVTFGSMNNFLKVSPAALDLWARLLGAVARARLLLYANPGRHLQSVLDRFAAAGVGAERIEFVPRQGWSAYIRTFGRIDVALDTFPYGGGITTLDALWMGTPVVTLAGKTAVGRGGVSILNNLGLAELVAESPEKYVEIAAALAGDAARLREFRREIRPRMEASPLMDGRRYAADVEAAFRMLWRRWCAERSS
jgi:protein O-GlcNAc transferase